VKLRKEVRQALETYIADKPKVTREELAVLIKQLEIPPDVPELMDREYNNAASRFLASKKDKKGHRTILSNPETKEFVNIEISNDINDLNAIKKKLHTNIGGYEYTISKIEMKTLALTGQISIIEYLNYSGETAVM
jgi:hypothetical protein